MTTPKLTRRQQEVLDAIKDYTATRSFTPAAPGHWGWPTEYTSYRSAPHRAAPLRRAAQRSASHRSTPLRNVF